MALFMSLVVLLSTVSFTMGMHYCGDMLVDFAFNESVTTCGMEKEPVAVSCETTSISKKSCCTDIQVVKKGNQDLKKSFHQLDLNQQIFIAAFIYSFLDRFVDTTVHQPSFDYDPPPLLDRDLLVWHQTFLI